MEIIREDELQELLDVVWMNSNKLFIKSINYFIRT